MNQNNKSRNVFTLLIAILFLVFSYYIIKTYFDEKTSNNMYNGGSFSFVYDNKQINDKLMYDENRTVKVVKNNNYTSVTNDIKSNLFLKLSNIEYYYDNINLIINSNYLDLYKIEKDNIKLVILGSDLDYYKINIYIVENTEEADLNDKSWKCLGESSLTVYPYQYYKVINDKYSVYVEFPMLLNKDKYSENIYNELVDKVKKSIKVKNNSNSLFGAKYNENIKLDNNTILLLKDSIIDSYYSETYDDNSLTYLSYYNQNNELIIIKEIDNVDNYLNTVSVTGEYNYKDYNVKVIDNNSIVINLSDKYYLICNNKNISDLNTYLDGILEIE